MIFGGRNIVTLLIVALCCCPLVLSGQEEGDAGLAVEGVEDAFQDNFFEALKEKGIGNLDKALSLLSRCNAMRPEESAVSYELGRIYLEQKQYVLAQTHLLQALEKEPANVWYLHAAVRLYLEQEDTGRAVALAERYRDQGWKHRMLLAGLYARAGDLEQAEILLKDDQLVQYAPVRVEELKVRIQQLRDSSEMAGEVPAETKAGETVSDAAQTVEGLRRSLATLAENGDYEQLLVQSNEGVSNFPAQPEFYYFKGLALLKTGAPEEALEVAEEGLAYLLEDNELELAFYRLMKEAYGLLGNEKKQKELENRIGQKGS